MVFPFWETRWCLDNLEIYTRSFCLEPEDHQVSLSCMLSIWWCSPSVFLSLSLRLCIRISPVHVICMSLFLLCVLHFLSSSFFFLQKNPPKNPLLLFAYPSPSLRRLCLLFTWLLSWIHPHLSSWPPLPLVLWRSDWPHANVFVDSA